MTDVELTTDEKAYLQTIVEEAKACRELARNIRTQGIKSDSVLSQDFGQTWARFEGLIKMARQLLDQAQVPAARELFRNNMESYFNEYSSLKQEV